MITSPGSRVLPPKCLYTGKFTLFTDLVHVVLTKDGKKIKKSKEISKTKKLNSCMLIMQLN
jgi:hypothetical protein